MRGRRRGGDDRRAAARSATAAASATGENRSVFDPLGNGNARGGVGTVKGYASRTGTQINLRALAAYGWGLMISAKGVQRDEGFDDIVVDNGAWWAFQNQQPFDVPAFEQVVGTFGRKAKWIVVPDIVMGGAASWALTLEWLPRLAPEYAVMLAVQDGFEPAMVRPYLGPRVGVFVGGSTEWKLATMAMWSDEARARGAACHVGRVNTMRRIWLCAGAGVDSYDGSGASRYLSELHKLEAARRQSDWIGQLGRLGRLAA